MKKFRPSAKYPVEIFVSVLRESTPLDKVCDTPASIVEYWRQNVENKPEFRQDKEQIYALFLNTRRRIIAHELVGMGTLDAVICHPRDVFRSAIVSSAHAVIIVHNHPSGDTTPSDADIKVARELIRAGQLLKIDLLDSLIVSSPMTPPTGFTSLRELGYFHW